MRIINFISLILIPFTALSVVTLLYMFLPVVTNLTHILNIKSQNIALLTTGFGVFYAFGLLIWGTLSDKFGRNNIIFLGLLSLAAITFVLPLYTNYRYLLLARCLQGFFASSFPPVILAWLAENLDSKYLKRAIALISCSFILAGTIGQWYGAIMIQTSINISMHTLAAIYLISGLMFYFSNKKILICSTIKNIPSDNKISLFKVFTQIPNVLFDIKLVRIYSSALFVLMSFVFLYVSLNLFKNNLLISIDQLRQVATLGMFVSLTSPWLLSKITATRILAICLWVMSITLAVQFLFIYKYMTVTYLFLIIHFIYISSIALAIPSMITCTSMFAKQQSRGVAVSIYTCILFIGASLGSFLQNYINESSLVILISVGLFIIGFGVLNLNSYSRTNCKPK